MAKINADNFKHYMELQSYTNTVDGNNQRIKSWETIAYLWVSLRALNSQEQLVSAQTESINSHVMETRYREDLTKLLRLKWTRDAVIKYFNIEGIKEVDGHDGVYMTIDVSESED